ncbi:hypothetical protein QLH51_16005 [Sphingomonas sp. 2R-10]|uniref:hypothetical protein n=1 Tax=Sphingomonas sp. 2R-10 TaxID=3045148 RepID=UPI000F77837A|nr:hypothetical protein [Sphingomonas sp. 2R-10]MDJ0278302.1 hypothetical protein [Sphingomonas sp. 2R-10]
MEAELVRGFSFILVLAGMCMSVPPALADGGRSTDTVRIVLKFVKRGAADLPVARFDPTSCSSCTVVTAPLFNAENARETVIALSVPRRRSLELAFQGPREAVRRVILEGGDLPFRYDAGRIVVQVPPVAADAVTAAEVATHIVEPGMVLRFEHADPARRAGFYATGPFPDVQRRAANVLEFAQREVVRELRLGEQVEREHLGRIQIMGFDTNAPHGHTDAPPHVHMHLRWPGNTGTQIGHYYIGADGLLTHNQVGVKDIPGRERRFGRGEPFTTVGPNGRGIYTHRITTEGWLELGRAGEKSCLIQPDGSTGFQSGATIRCPGHPVTRIRVEDDRSRGVITVATGDVTETFRYDTDTGALTSPAAVTPPGPSVYQDEPINPA